MKKNFLMLFFLAGCGTTYTYIFQLNKPVASKELQFKDSLIDISFNIEDKKVEFNLNNLSTDTLKVNWDESYMVLDSETKKIFHKGIKYSEKNDPQALTEINPNSSINDFMMPKDNVVYQKIGRTFGWYKKDLIATGNFWPIELEENARRHNTGKTFEIHLILEKNNQKLYYIFEFLIKDLQKH